MKLTRRTFATSLGTLLLISAAARAHEPRKGPNGGELVDAGNYHVEVVGRGSLLEVYVSDQLDRPLKANDFKVLAIMLIDGKTHRITMEPTADGSRFTATSPAAITRVRGAVQLTDKARKTATGRVN
jgi:hypothetical protein